MQGLNKSRLCASNPTSPVQPLSLSFITLLVIKIQQKCKLVYLQIMKMMCSKLKIAAFISEVLFSHKYSQSILVSLHVKCEVIRPWESSCANMTSKRFDTRMFPLVSCQLIWPGKLPTTIWPWASVRLFTSVGSDMCLQEWSYSIVR